ncbi:protein ecdysoneless homolog [Tubulanus polymorphus]|uniref:protein ecdysoneless homolog n=1 Tax=Tubulanus polymorphus TaxID=672921 RepID=UPI003DA306E6
MATDERRLPEDVVEYLLFPYLPDTFDDEVIEDHLEKQLDLYLAYLSQWLVDYIWQNQPFHLCVVSGFGPNPSHLKGTTNYGDNVEDEWFILYLLVQLTNNFPDLVVQIHDSDGEFLLIEAADVIPKWLNPDTSENRIFLHRGKVHIVPIPQNPADAVLFPLWTPSIEEAIKCITENPDKTEASEAVQKTIQRRLSGYPNKINQNIHRTSCYVPASISTILKSHPHLVAPAVQAFYFRDPIDLQACRTFTHFPPTTRVMTQVKFTRCLYAQLSKQKFQPDRHCGYTMMPPMSPRYKAYDLGMKLAHGFEILCAKCSNSNRSTANGHISASDIRWQRYLKSLKTNGYFKGEIEGSRLYRQFLDKAKKYFNDAVRSTDENSPDPGVQILNLLKTLPVDIEKLRREEQNLPKDDDDSWLDVTPEQLDNILDKAAQHHRNVSPGVNQKSTDIVNQTKSFVNRMSSHEGVEFGGGDDDVNFEAGGIIASMQKMFDFKDEVSSDEMSDDYGSDGGEETHDFGTRRRSKSPDGLGDMNDYMELMDKELSKTNVGKSFVKKEQNKTKSQHHQNGTNRPQRPPPPQPPPQQKTQLSPQPPARPPQPPPRNKKGKKINLARMEDLDDIDNIDDDFEAVDVDMNLVKNMLDSYASQQGSAGPASNILRSQATTNSPKNSPRKTPRKETNI